MNMIMNMESVGEREITYVRVFNAPRAMVWSARSNPEHLAQWWGPDGFTNTFHEFDFRPGGHWRFISTARTAWTSRMTIGSSRSGTGTDRPGSRRGTQVSGHRNFEDWATRPG